MTVFFPSTLTQWKDLGVLLFAGLLGFLVRPVVWPVFWFNPFLYLLALAVTAAQEGTYNRNASGDSGNSIGLLQFNVKTWPDLTGRDLADRTSPWWSGWYAAAFIEEGLLLSWDWWLPLATPVFGMAALRHMWTGGTGEARAKTTWAESWNDESAIGEKTWPAYRGWLAVLAAPVVIVAGVLLRLLGLRRGRK